MNTDRTPRAGKFYRLETLEMESSKPSTHGSKSTDETDHEILGFSTHDKVTLVQLVSFNTLLGDIW